MAQPIPEGMHTLTPHLVVRGAAKAIDFYKRAFAATEIARHPGPKGKLMHAHIAIGDSRMFLVDEMPEMGGDLSPLGYKGSAVTLHLYVEDVDKVFAQAVAAGAKVKMPVMDMFWGDRYGQVTDPFGHVWSIATHQEDVAPEELGRRGEEAMKQFHAQRKAQGAKATKVARKAEKKKDKKDKKDKKRKKDKKKRR